MQTAAESSLEGPGRGVSTRGWWEVTGARDQCCPQAHPQRASQPRQGEWSFWGAGEGFQAEPRGEKLLMACRGKVCMGNPNSPAGGRSIVQTTAGLWGKRGGPGGTSGMLKALAY
jgi:hypothetical protein